LGHTTDKQSTKHRKQFTKKNNNKRQQQITVNHFTNKQLTNDIKQKSNFKKTVAFFCSKWQDS
jgi:hypothetical protein